MRKLTKQPKDNSDVTNNFSEEREKEKSLIRKIVFSIVFVGLLLVLIVGIVGYNYVSRSLEPYNLEETDLVEVEIPLGTTTKGIAEIMEEKELVNDATVFNYYMKTQNVDEFQAGFYQVAPAMTLDEIISVLEKGGTSAPTADDHKILIREGATVEEIADEFAEKTEYTKDDFIKTVNDEEFLKSLMKEYPNVITEALKNKDIKYKLEGYLFPATYDYLTEYTPEDMITMMVEKTDEVLMNYQTQIDASDYSLHELLTLASLVEKEGVVYEDRQKIADVFFNRLEKDMPIQSDISILYSLGSHNEYVTIKDTEVDSPYNLYLNKGIGPGPFNNPSEESIKAVLNPVETDFLYFLADLETGKVYFSKNFEEHLEYQEKYVKDPDDESNSE